MPGAALGGTLAVQTGGGEGLTAVNARAYYQCNDLGTVLATTDANGARVGLWRPTFFGEYDDTMNWNQGPTAAAGSPVWPEIGLTGKIWDEDAKLYYFNARWYDPHRGRWMSKEPTGLDGPNLYHFTFNNPVENTDINGLYSSQKSKRKPDTLNDEEEALYDDSSSYHLYMTMKCHDYAFTESAKSALPGLAGGPQDALRHCMWQCCMARALGKEYAKKWGDAHEARGGRPDETAMDLHNNCVGREIASEPYNCTNSCKKAMEKNKLEILPENRWRN